MAKKRFQNLVTSFKNIRQNKKLYVALLVIGLLLLVFYKKSWFVAAIVNGQAISAFELNNRLNNLYKDRILNQLINEKVLEQEAAKKGISITPPQVNDKIKEAETAYGGKETFEMLLSQQGITRDEFIRQTRLQLLVEKLYENESSPSGEEVKKFMEDNANVPEATDAAKFKQLAEDSVRQQKLSKIFGEKFQSLRQSAKIQIF
ncbi:SurA N-terminal domain-containing protein [Candidatus Daviesbacteria bacterium]|nr:SurA N-terminal domain-containing protein [Candidatus Daviesbacteria bacterium]